MNSRSPEFKNGIPATQPPNAWNGENVFIVFTADTSIGGQGIQKKCFLKSLRESKQALIQQLPEHHKFACFPKAFIFAYFAADLVLSTT